MGLHQTKKAFAEQRAVNRVKKHPTKYICNYLQGVNSQKITNQTRKEKPK
jgi:hypothetical protein